MLPVRIALTPFPLADLPGNLRGDGLVLLAAEVLETLAKVLLADNVEHRRLAKLHPEGLVQGGVKYRVAGLVDEVGDDDAVLQRSPACAVGSDGGAAAVLVAGTGLVPSRLRNRKAPAAAATRSKAPTRSCGCAAGAGRLPARESEPGLGGAGVGRPQSGSKSGAGNGFQVGEKFLGAAVTLIAVLGQQLGDHGIESLGHGGIEAADRGRIFHQQGGKHLGGAAAGKRGLPGRHLVQHAAQAEEVGAGIERVALGLLRRHVGGGADGRARGGEIHRPGGRRRYRFWCRSSGSRARLRAPCFLARPKSRILSCLRSRPLSTTKRLAGLISRCTMPLACAAARALAACWPRVSTSDGERLWWVRYELQRLASQQLHHQVGLSVLFAHVVNGADVGVVQGGRRPGLAQEALMGKVDPGVRSASGRRTAGARIGDEKAVGDELESDFAFESRVQGAIDVTHTARADLFDDSVGPKNSSSSDHCRPKRLDSRPFRGPAV